MNYQKKKKKAQLYAQRVKQRNELRAIRHKYDLKRNIPTHKVITVYLFIVFNVILIYSFIAMWHFADLTHLGILVTSIAGQVATFLIYSKHSTAQNTSGGIVFETAMEQMRHTADELTQKEKDEAVG